MKVSDPKIINITCDTKETGTTTCIEGNRHDVIIGKPIGICKEMSTVYLFCYFQVVITEKNQFRKVFITGQINIPVRRIFAMENSSHNC